MQNKISATIYTEGLEPICNILIKLAHPTIFQEINLLPISAVLPQKNTDSNADEKTVLQIIEELFINNNLNFNYKKFTKSSFAYNIFENLANIKYGETITYKELAISAGNPKAARAVGNALRHNPLPLVFPCHRVIGVNGLGGYSGNHNDYIEIKRRLLNIEKVRQRIVIR